MKPTVLLINFIDLVNNFNVTNVLCQFLKDLKYIENYIFMAFLKSGPLHNNTIQHFVGS